MRPDELPERTGTLVIRAWLESSRSELIARITGRADVLSGEDETSVTVVGSEAATEVVRDWLVEFEQRTGEAELPADPGDRPRA